MHIPFFAIVRFPYEISCFFLSPYVIEMEKGETGNLAYIIISGTVSVWQRTPGSCHIFDEISVIEDGPDQNGGELQFFDPKKDAETVKKVRSDTYSRKYFICLYFEFEDALTVSPTVSFCSFFSMGCSSAGCDRALYLGIGH
jgi:hypothetical protein